MNTDKLKKILADHKVWVESGEQRGKRADLSGADLSGADLSGASLSCASLNGANLSGADLSDADLYKTDLYGTDLRCANLNGANLYYANLFGAYLTGAHFELEIKTVNSFQYTCFSESAIPWVILHSRWSEWADSVKFA